MQNTNEILSRYLLYEARDDEATETRASYAAIGCKAAEISALSEAKREKASKQRKTRHKQASETKRTLKAVYKRLKAEEAREYEARDEEASQRRTQQQCILSGEVYLRHRPRKASLPKNLLALLFPQRYYNTRAEGVQLAAFGRTGVQETIPLSN